MLGFLGLNDHQVKVVGTPHRSIGASFIADLGGPGEGFHCAGMRWKLESVSGFAIHSTQVGAGKSGLPEPQIPQHPQEKQNHYRTEPAFSDMPLRGENYTMPARRGRHAKVEG